MFHNAFLVRKVNIFGLYVGTMFYIFITVFVIASGLTAADESCSRRYDEVCQSDTETFIPKNAEDLERFCGIIIKMFECAIDHEERCHTLSEFSPDGHQYFTTFQEMCNPGTLLNAAVRKNIECFSEKVKDEAKKCYRDVPSNETLEKQAEELSIDLEALTVNEENEENREKMCLDDLNEVACQAILTEKKCGPLAKDAFVELARKLPKYWSWSCTDQAIQKLPTIIRLRELENTVEEALERKK